MELIDILDEQGQPTGEILPKREAHRYGHFHASTHLWLYTKTGKVVLQLRAASKPNFPNCWDVSVAGHISSGETAKQTAVREAAEELGITVNQDDLHYVGRFRIDYRHAEDYWDREFITIYACALTEPLPDFSLQTEEVADVTAIPLAQVEAELADETLAKKYVPFNKAYAAVVFAKLKTFFSEH